VQEKCRLKFEVSVVSLSKGRVGTTVAGSAQSLEELNTLRVVGGRAREVCAKSLKGVRVDKLRRDSSFVILWEQTQERLEQEEALEQKKSSRRRINGQGSQEENREIPLTVRSGRSCAGLVLRRRRKDQSHRDSAKSSLTLVG
jgi:hypothetical protein